MSGQKVKTGLLTPTEKINTVFATPHPQILFKVIFWLNMPQRLIDVIETINNYGQKTGLTLFRLGGYQIDTCLH